MVWRFNAPLMPPCCARRKVIVWGQMGKNGGISCGRVSQGRGVYNRGISGPPRARPEPGHGFVQAMAVCVSEMFSLNRQLSSAFLMLSNALSGFVRPCLLMPDMDSHTQVLGGWPGGWLAGWLAVWDRQGAPMPCPPARRAVTPCRRPGHGPGWRSSHALPHASPGAWPQRPHAPARPDCTRAALSKTSISFPKCSSTGWGRCRYRPPPQMGYPCPILP